MSGEAAADRFEYVVVGGGSAGCVLATRSCPASALGASATPMSTLRRTMSRSVQATREIILHAEHDWRQHQCASDYDCRESGGYDSRPPGKSELKHPSPDFSRLVGCHKCVLR